MTVHPELLARPEDYAAAKGTATDLDDLAVLMALQAASGTVRRKTQQSFDYVEEDEVRLDGHGTQSLLLPELPVHGVSEVALLANDETETLIEDWTLGAAGILYRRGGFRAGINNVRLVYAHGYILPGQEDTDGIPALPVELTLVTIQIATRSRVFQTTEGQTLTAKQIGSYRVEYSEGTTEDIPLTALEMDVLDGYRQSTVI